MASAVSLAHERWSSPLPREKDERCEGRESERDSHFFQLPIGEIFIDDPLEVLVRPLTKDPREIEASEVREKRLNVLPDEERAGIDDGRAPGRV